MMLMLIFVLRIFIVLIVVLLCSIVRVGILLGLLVALIYDRVTRILGAILHVSIGFGLFVLRAIVFGMMMMIFLGVFGWGWGLRGLRT